MKIVLLGYMASGKSLIGKKLSAVMEYDFIDLDDYIEQNENKTITDIFSDKGEIYFRKAEHFFLKEILSQEKNMVLALGGGTPCYYNNMKTILENQDVVSVYLNVPLSEIVNRLKNEKESRPIVSHISKDEDLFEFVGKHLFERSHFYRQANFIIQANSSPEAIVKEIVLNLF